ncbi:hypothetical protein MD484_g7183, partial [Candolleomyces efflorescens]
MVQWRNPQGRKHKTWEGDAVLVRESSGKSTLYESDGRIIGTGRLDISFSAGTNTHFCSKDIEFDCPIEKQDFLSGACFGKASANFQALPPPPASVVKKKFVSPALNALSPLSSSSRPSRAALQDANVTVAPPVKEDDSSSKLKESHWTVNWRKQQTKKHKTWDGDAYISFVSGQIKMISETGKPMGSVPWKGEKPHSGLLLYIAGKAVELDSKITAAQIPGLREDSAADGDSVIETEDPPVQPEVPHARVPSKFVGVAPSSFYAAVKPKPKGPLHDADAPGAVVMKSPNKIHMQRYNKQNLPVVPVVLDPILSRKMREHQIEGVKFMYECVMGLRKHEGNGCVLADEMGLGKTLQTIGLIWTLLRQNPYAGPIPAARKVLIVCPVSLITVEFPPPSNDKVSSAVPPIDLIVCDEGHRLKSANNKTAAMFQSLRTRRRIILSGTPIQNDLSEFHAMTEFCNPGLLDEYATFRRVFENPILKSRAPGATTKEIEIGEARTEELLKIANSFVLRRDASLLRKHLPPKHEYVVFVTPTALQVSMFSAILSPDRLDDLTRGSTADALALINILTKICNSPILLKATADSAKAKSGDGPGPAVLRRGGVQESLKMIPPGVEVGDMRLSGKLIALERMLADIRENTEEKCVLVSHYTSTLGILEAFCRKKNYSYFRLDGQTPQQKRQEYVNNFNKSSQRGGFIFLLSSKAGGVGINLIGGSRLFLIDSDWNPRDGQKRPVYIYRLITAGTIDEKIFQRQVTKLGLSSSVIGSESNASKTDSFSQKDLRDIFRIDSATGCNTHDLIGCNCDGTKSPTSPGPGRAPPPPLGKPLNRGFMSASSVNLEDTFADEQYMESKKAELASLGEWKHVNCLKPTATDDVLDDVLRAVLYDCGPKPKSFASIEGGSKMSRLLQATDIQNIQAMDRVVSVGDVPSGTVSFLFEKGGQTTDEVQEEGEGEDDA